MKLANMDAGKSLRVLMAEKKVSAIQLGFDLGISSTTVSTLRREKLISGRNLVMLSEHFGISAADFIRKGEEEA